MKTKVALYDFDDTIIKSDSIKHLLIYYIKRHPLALFRVLMLGIYWVLYALKIITKIKAKEEMLFPLKYLSDSELEYFVKKILQPHFYDNVVKTVYKHKEEGCVLFLVSASAELYLKYVQDILPFDVVMGTITNKNVIHGLNCKNEEKVRRINEKCINLGIEIDYDNSYAYSDSRHDIPMLSMVKNRYRVELKTGKLSEFIW